ncbi:MAG: Gfo/Idh/MocA family oxidoreductase [Chloroflexota bacterium]|nr:Gfo/Idh/MocA family oxidoreductase [Chloroflexota bacterium]MDE2839366.1 Gfo/Idh/MocA family oxidoreductase [Chloroflexota bacterium]MDE2931394.1 Gfo/Idh/MocA family oxidoreductase [Chloroflexota bacterium]
MGTASENTRKLRIAVLGVGADPGSRARHFLATIARLTDHYEMTAICDRSPDVLAQVGAQYGVPSQYTDVRALFANEQQDVMLSLTPKDSHIVMALTAARHGCHIITEIPVALTRRHAAAIAETCRENGVLWEVAEQVWLWPRERLKRQIIDAGLLGEVTHARLWYQTGQYHAFSGIRALIDAPAKRVLGYCGEVPTEPYVAYGGEPENSLKWDSGVIEFANGVVCLFEKPPRVFPSSHITFPTGWEIEGTKGNLSRDVLVQYLEGQSPTFPIQEHYTEQDGSQVLESLSVATDPPVVWENPYARYGIATQDDAAKADILTSFHQAITTGTEPQYGVAEGVRDYELCLAVRESADRGNAWVELPLKEPTDLEERIEAEFLRRYGHDPIEDTDALLDATFTRSATLWPFAHWL